MRKAIALIAAIVSVGAFGNELTEACQGNAPTATEYRNSPKDYADNFCALWMHERSKALRQLSQSVKTNRVINDPNRWYFDSKLYPNAEPIQLRRPWMEGKKMKFIDFGKHEIRNSIRICENDGEDQNCIRIDISQGYWPLLVYMTHPLLRKHELSSGSPWLEDNGEYMTHPLLRLHEPSSSDRPWIEDDGKNGYHKLEILSRFPNASEAKVCVEAILDRMKHRHYWHPSVESACGGTFECKWWTLDMLKEDKIWSCRIERE